MKRETLEPIAPEQAKELYLQERHGEVSQRTLDAHNYRLKHFIQWCEQQGIDNMNDMTGRRLHEYRLWRKDDGDLKAISLRTQLQTLRVFVKFCETIDAVPDDLHDKILLPTLSTDQEQREEILRAEQAEPLLDYLRRFEYASRHHAIVELLWHTGMRLGAFHGLDVSDFNRDEAYLEINHRPDSNTAIKNGVSGQRLVALSESVRDTIADYVDHHRRDVTGDNGREPLFTTDNGRIAQTTIRETVYRVTRPCYYAECPHDRDPTECNATNSGRYSRCPSSVSPHSVRRGSITNFLTRDVPETVVSDRMDVGKDTLEKHYDKRSEEVKMEQRRSHL